MSKPSQYLLLSLPNSIVPSHHRDDALQAISTTISPDNGSATSFPIPEFKIGTLDALVQQADELAKLEASCQGVVAKVGEALKNILGGDEAQIESMKVVNDSMFSAWSELDFWSVGELTVLQSLSINTFVLSNGIRSSTGLISRWPS
jgi:V-type H+-transporting ATPase subunit C